MREKILGVLQQATGYVSGEDLSRRLNISRAGVWKNIEELRKLGYTIAAVSNTGYQLTKSPDKLFPWEIKAGLTTRTFGQEVFCHETLVSTMDEAFRAASQGKAEGTLVVAESQSKGRGRMGREWVSPKGKGLYFSLIVRPEVALNEVAKLTLLSGVAVCEALRNVSGLDVQIKWPNDLLLGTKKIAGILTELNAEMDRVKFVIIGVGVNVNTNSRQLPLIATSLKVAAGKEFSRVRVLQEILKSLEKYYDVATRQSFDPVLAQWKTMSATLGQRVTLTDHGKSLSGVAIDLSEEGGLLIRDDSGKIFKKMSGDVVSPV